MPPGVLKRRIAVLALILGGFSEARVENRYGSSRLFCWMVGTAVNFSPSLRFTLQVGLLTEAVDDRIEEFTMTDWCMTKTPHL